MTGVLISEMVLAYETVLVHEDGLCHQRNVSANFSQSTSLLIKGISQVAMALISDFVMVYRTFLVWEGQVGIIAVPVLILLADIGLGIWSGWSLFHAESFQDIARSDEVIVPVRAFFILGFALNAISAGLICWKIRSVQLLAPLDLTGMRDGRVSRVFDVLVQTASIYCIHLFILIVAESIGSNVYILFVEPLLPVTALVFTMLIPPNHRKR
ncbi:hypothetical protein C8Q76DRAFT_793097 [Earliella scabrosa]|nr:hypothetical protein C8Q76DRAFT_793097 [Earliella scabrosa]